MRFKWTVNNPPGIGDVAIWDNRSTFHTVNGDASRADTQATFDYDKKLRIGDRVLSVGEKPYYDPSGKEWRRARSLPSWHED